MKTKKLPDYRGRAAKPTHRRVAGVLEEKYVFVKIKDFNQHCDEFFKSRGMDCGFSYLEYSTR